MNKLLIFWLLASLLISCNSLDTPSKNIEQGFNKAAEGMQALAKIDPLGLNTLLEKNEALRNLIDSLNRQIYGKQSMRVIDLKNKKVQLIIPEYFGSFKLLAYLDKKDNVLIDRKLDYKETKINFDFANQCRNYVFRYFNTPGPTSPLQRQSQTVDPNSLFYGNLCTEFEELASTQYLNFFKSTKGFSNSKLSPADLNPKFGDGNIHLLYLSITPTSMDEFGKWKILSNVILASSDSTSTEYFTQIGKESIDFPNHKLGTPLPTISIPIRIK